GSAIQASHYQAPRPGARPRLSLEWSFGALRQMHVEPIALPANTALVGQTIAETQLRSTTGALTLAVRRGEDDFGTPGADFRLDAGDVLVVVGQPQQIRLASQLLTGKTP